MTGMAHVCGRTIFLTVFFICLMKIEFTLGNFVVPYAWRNVEFWYPNEEDRQSAIQNGTYIPENVVLNDIDVWEDNVRGQDTGGYRLFVTTPRVRAGIPATLSLVTSAKRDDAFLLSPFPEWSSQIVSEDCNGFVSVDKIHIDRCGYLWVIDTGKINEFSNSQRLCAAKLLIYDLRNDDENVLRYEFPPEVLNDRSYLTTILTDTRSDSCQDAVAYIADMKGHGLVVFDLANRTSSRINHNYFYPYPRHGTYTIGGVTFNLMDGVFGMALGPVLNEDRLLYFHSLASLRESWVPTSVLRNQELVNETNQVQLRSMFGLSDEFRRGQCSLEVMTPDGIMIYNDLLNNALYCWNPASEPIRANTQIILQDNERHFEFISGMKLKGDRLWMASNQVQNIIGNVESNTTDYRYRIIFVRSVRQLLNNSGRRCLAGIINDSSNGMNLRRPQ